MARTAHNQKIDSRSARLKLKARREPYWTRLSSGCHLGYRRIADGGGSWIGRFRDAPSGKRVYDALGPADDFRDADGLTAFTVDQAQERARTFFKREAAKLSADWAPESETLTVSSAMAAYLTDYEQRGGRALASTQSVVNAHILPDLGNIDVAKLTRTRLVDWRNQLAAKPPRVRSKKGEGPKFQESDDKRRRQSTANRILTVLKAGLNYVHNEGQVTCRPVWQQVKPFKDADAARCRFLDDDEVRALVNTCPSDFRELVTAAIMTGCRYGELGRLTKKDYSPESGTLFIARSKNGGSRNVYLTDEGNSLFARLSQGRGDSQNLLLRANGKPWGKSEAQRPLEQVCKRANVETLTFHELRHTYASRLIMRGASLLVVANQLGHSSTRMVEKHYGHLAPSHVASSVRAAFQPLLTVV